jgi:nucleotide-binding universal stress UspA family protein
MMYNPPPFKYILVPFEGSTSSRRALEVGLTMAKAFQAKVALVTVEEYLPQMPGDIGEVIEEKERQNHFYQSVQREAREQAKIRGIELERADILVGHVAQTLLNHASQIQCDLIVMGHSGRSGVWGRFLGTTADKVSRYAHCTVVIAR